MLIGQFCPPTGTPAGTAAAICERGHARRRCGVRGARIMAPMEMRIILFSALAAAGLWQGLNRWQLRPVHPADGAIAADEPLQTDIVGTPPITTLGRWRLTPRARYDITARILSREDYHFDPLSDLVPEDLALGWGAMSDNRVLRE